MNAGSLHPTFFQFVDMLQTAEHGVTDQAIGTDLPQPDAVAAEQDHAFTYEIPGHVHASSFRDALKQLCPDAIQSEQGRTLVLHDLPASSRGWSVRAAIAELVNPADILYT